MKFSHEVCKIGLELNFELDLKKWNVSHTKELKVYS